MVNQSGAIPLSRESAWRIGLVIVINSALIQTGHYCWINNRWAGLPNSVDKSQVELSLAFLFGRPGQSDNQRLVDPAKAAGPIFNLG